jgi:hypothetical protein
MFAGQGGGERIVYAGAAASRVAVDGDRDTDARAADDDTLLGTARAYDARKLQSEFRVIDAFGTVGSEILDLVSLVDQPARELVLQNVSGMVSGKGNAHAGFLARKFTTRHRCGREAD